MHIKKLKITLQSKYLYIGVLLITIIYVILNIYFVPKKSKYEISENKFVFIVDNIKTSTNNFIITFSGKEKIISYYEKEFPYKIGDYVYIEGTLNIPNKNTIPNLFNYREYLYNQDIFYILDIEKIKLLKENENIFIEIKNNIINYIHTYKTSHYLYAFILGNTSYINEDIKNKYLDLGINHLFAISGMHVSLLIAIISYFLNKFKVNDYLIFAVIMLFLIFYSFLVNYQISIIRSVLCYLFLSINRFLKLKIPSEYILIFVFSITLLFNPFNIYNIGFQYSYLISYMLIKYRSLIDGNYLKKTFIISLIAFFAGMPITIFHNSQINVLSIFFNIIYVPLISLIIFPSSLLCLVLPIFDLVFFKIISLLETLTVFLDNFSLIISLRKPNLIVIILYLIIIIYILNGFRKSKYARMFLLIILLFFHYNINFYLKDNELLMFDVDQGDSLLLNYSNKVVLIDTGGSIKRDYSKNIIEYMKTLGIKKIDYLIISHGDYDHMGEAINLVNNFKVEKVIFNCGYYNDLEQELIKVLDKKRIKYYSCIRELNIDNNKLYFLQTKEYDNENDNSNVIYTELNGYKFMFMGDASITTEKEIIDKYNLSDIDVLKVGHHGSKTSSSAEFINEIKPKYSVISVGKNNRYGHPNKEVLKKLENSKIYRTDQNGSIIFKIKNNKLKIETCSP